MNILPAKMEMLIGWYPIYDFIAFNQSIDTVIMGYKAYEKSLTFGGELFKGKKYYIYLRHHYRLE